MLRINAASRPAVAALDRAELARLIAAGASAQVAISEAGELIGYLLVFARGAPYDGEEFRYFSAQLRGEFLYVDQLAVEAGWQRSGAGRACYQALIAEARSRGIAQLCCEVNTNPPNPGSLKFHQRLGFTAIGNGDTLDGRSVVYLVKQI